MSNEPQWQPIETAPKDGNKLLLYSNIDLNGKDDDKTVVGLYGELTWCHDEINIESEYLWYYRYVNPINATHWMPLPEPPETNSEWQSIETAPKDYTDLLLYFEKGFKDFGQINIGHYGHTYFLNEIIADYEKVIGWISCHEKINPTHWMNIPKPPQINSNK
jgi:hypothetical protein